ncbi:GNAT family acetyltransferase [Chamaesiphon sp. GL140_3_metabinner_50]|uniref:GNAT family acetyltransferase n=1 Tax=Chamaesiphon sp. GL140_3_metabinner_50 TaxID=2970812 RepID=UPI0025D21CCB|nr:GNAT family acetyltransferase [Chamaesiphon sp. GL140_3_metabinner_50]
MSPIIRIAIESDIDGILNLQSRNLYANLSATDLADGFVTTPFTADLLRQLLDLSGVFVAVHERKIIGYLLAGDWHFFSRWEIFRLMISRLPELGFMNKEITVDRSFQYGPICIDRDWRGSTVFPNLFALMRSSFESRFPVGVTFINKLNERSFTAHTRKLDLEIVDEFEFNGNSFYTVAFLTSAGYSDESHA